MTCGNVLHHYNFKMISMLTSSQDRHFTTWQMHYMAISKMKVLIPQKLNIKITSPRALHQRSVGNEFAISQSKNVSLEKTGKS